MIISKHILSFFTWAVLCSATTKLLSRDNEHGPFEGHWVDAWAAMPQLTEPANLPPPPFNSTDLVFFNTTIRQTLRIVANESNYQMRIRLSNAFGLVELPITSLTIAIPTESDNRNLTGSSSIDITSLQHVTFSGNKSIVVPPGAIVVSDPLAVEACQIVSLSLYLASGQQSQAITSHPGSRTTSWMSRGDHTLAENLTDASTTSVAHWYYISAIEAWQPPSHSAFVLVGDSITDGRGSDTNGNNRWPDLLLDRMAVSSPGISVINQAAGGNRVLADGLGPSALSRIERDVLSHSGVRYVLLFEGVNDIGTGDISPSAQGQIGDRLIQAYRQIITRVHAMQLPIFGATITPFGCDNTTIQPYSDPEREKTRQRMNEWIRESEGRPGGFDKVVDFDKVLRGQNVSKLDSRYDGGDCLHPNVAGYTALAEAFPLGIFEEYREGVNGYV
ncbi:related to lysophospholipase L1 and related esterases [Ramularia collo-cygni]|uniref:Related to lysophospholipase L1 and related esterases n=1 Tax=Ramularia collo-cygni TaxID=112498 RepID=A0A2D3ULK2_9PEZI|nr:related to lysophospholipase L1 and related esterases [Ramularia collo-cygni]CZT15042.1 related to lysophospholipase L1 and related esterases [Ramularia collo-cygni]